MGNDQDRPTVWALSKGEYSDYTVVAIFTTKRQAEAAQREARHHPVEFGGDYRVEPFPLFAEDAPPPRVVTRYERQVDIMDDGSVGDERISSYREWEFDQLYRCGRRPFVRFVRAPIHKDRGGRLEVRGTDEQAVAQAFSDNLARIKAHADATGKAGPQVHV